LRQAAAILDTRILQYPCASRSDASAQKKNGTQGAVFPERWSQPISRVLS
jgi:hypothetical protein